MAVGAIGTEIGKLMNVCSVVTQTHKDILSSSSRSSLWGFIHWFVFKIQEVLASGSRPCLLTLPAGTTSCYCKANWSLGLAPALQNPPGGPPAFLPWANLLAKCTKHEGHFASISFRMPLVVVRVDIIPLEGARHCGSQASLHGKSCRNMSMAWRWMGLSRSQTAAEASQGTAKILLACQGALLIFPMSGGQGRSSVAEHL